MTRTAQTSRPTFRDYTDRYDADLPAMPTEVKHEGATGTWFISFDPPPIPVRDMDWRFHHDDFDGAPDSNDHRCGNAASLEDAIEQIREMEAEGEDEELRYLTETGAV